MMSNMYKRSAGKKNTQVYKAGTPLSLFVEIAHYNQMIFKELEKF